MSSMIAAQSAVWEQARVVRARLGGPSWRQAFTGPVPLPSWLVTLVDGHMDAYVGPDPVLFRAAGIGSEWFTMLEQHPSELEVTCAHASTPSEQLREAAVRLQEAGGQVDADAYVWAGGPVDGRFSVRIHSLFGVFSPAKSPEELVRLMTQLEDLSHRFMLAVTPSKRETLVTMTPILVPEGVAA